MTKDEALKLALEALEEAWYHVGTFQPTEKAIDLYDEARAAIKEALAQPDEDYKRGYADAMNWKAQNHLEHLPPKEQAPMNYYRADAEGNLERTDIHFAQPKPVAWMCADESLINKGYARFSHVCMGDWKIPVYTTPPQHTWVGLSDAEIKKIVGADRYTDLLLEVVKVVEAKLKEKNT